MEIRMRCVIDDARWSQVEEILTASQIHNWESGCQVKGRSNRACLVKDGCMDHHGLMGRDGPGARRRNEPT